MDSVLNRLQDEWVELIGLHLGERLTVADITSWDRLAPERYQALLKTPWLFRHTAVEPGAQEALRTATSAGHQVFAVSAGRPWDYQDKHLWLRQYFPVIPERNIIFTTCKEELAQPGRAIIDDGPHIIEAWREAGGVGIVFDQPWNQNVSGLRLCRWADATKMLSQYQLERG